MASDLSYEEVLSRLWQLELTHYCSIAGITLLVFDYVLTFDSEIQLIWKSRWNAVKILFCMARYMPFFDAVAVIIYLSVKDPQQEQCTALYRFLGWWALAGVAVVELLLTFRIWAVWGNSRGILSLTTALYMMIWAGICVFMASFLDDILFAKPMSSVGKHGCLNVGANKSLAKCWLLIGLYDMIILLLLAWKAWPALRLDRALGPSYRLSAIVYTDGLIYYMYLFILSAINVVVILSLPTVFINLLTVLERVMYSLLTCRAILHIRRQREKELKDDLDNLIHDITARWSVH